MKLINCNHVKKRPSFRLSGQQLSKLLPLSLMCLILISDFQREDFCGFYQIFSNKIWLKPIKAAINQSAQDALSLLSDNNIIDIRNSIDQVDTAELSLRAKPLEASQRRASSRLVLFADANPDANRLYEDLMMTYNRIVRPVQNNSDRVVVKLSLKLSQLIDVNLKNQMMTTNVWLNQEWSDYKLKWDPSEYGGIEDINLPAEQIWLPDIVLYNSAEGYFAVSIMTKAKVHYDGHVTWNPPAIFRSSCQIDITYFPFDSQNCHLKFGSWTFGTKIDLRHINDTEQAIERGTDLSEYYQNVEWDIMQASARRNVITYICCPNDFYPDVTFNFTLRRKPLFYTVNLILPCVGITILSFLVFYLPSDSGEKVTLTISILVSLIFFLSVLIETIPSTSLAMPLLGKYLVFTMILITVSVCATVCVLNIHFRTPSTHSMPAWVKRWCIEIMPRYLFMNVPQHQSQQAGGNLLPEQLIYPHNQAYLNSIAASASAAVAAKTAHQQSSAANNSRPTNAAPTDWPAPPTALPPEAPSQAQKRKREQKSRAASLRSQAGSSMRQLNPSTLDSEHSAAAGGNNDNSPSSLFLPYLQSETARRLQLQRSRSSDRDNRSASECHQVVANGKGNTTAQHGSNNNNNNCDIESNASIRKSSGKRSSGPKRRWFGVGGAKSASPSGSSSRAEGGAKGEERGADESAGGQQSSSSTMEYDYQHHNHFQARASICSTNLWRIGPTRRCSLAVPANYPTFYRPLVQPPIGTVSGCLQPGAHFHSDNFNEDEDLDEDSSSSTSSSFGSKGAVRALISNVANSLAPASRQKTVASNINKPTGESHGQEMRQFGGLIQRNQQLPYVAAANGQPNPRVNISLPCPEVAGLQQQQANFLALHRQQQQQSHLAAPHGQQSRQPVVQLPIGVTSRGLILNPMSVEEKLSQQLGSSCRPAACSFAQQPATNCHFMQQSSGQSNSSNQSAAAGCPQQQRIINLNHPIVSATPSSRYMAGSVGHLAMPRSRSSDHRLCMYARPTGGSLYLQQSNQHQQLQNPAQSIGRALGQAYMQRLQRQPNTYSISSNIQRQSRPMQRGTTYLLPLDSRQQHQHPQTAFTDSMRRSRSQTSLSLDRRIAGQQYHQVLASPSALGAANSDCEQCNSLRQVGASRSLQLGAEPGAGCQCAQLYLPDNRIQTNVSMSSSLMAARNANGSLRFRQQREQCCSSNINSSINQTRRARDGYDCMASNQTADQELHGCGRGYRNGQLATKAKAGPPPLTSLGLMRLINEVDKAIQNAMFIAQHIDNLDEFESVKENWKYIAMVIDRIFLIVFLFACIVGTVTIFAMVPWSYYTTEKPIDLQLTKLMALNLTGGETYSSSCREF